MKIFVDGLEFPEAPVLLPDGSFLVTEMSPQTGCVTWVSADGKSRKMLARTGRPNGLAPDAAGNIWVAESLNKQLLKLGMDGSFEVFAGAEQGRPFRFLNDLALAPNGDIYLTDSGIELDDFAPGGELNPAWKSLKYDGRVYRIDVQSGEVETVDTGIQFTNGIAFGADQNLYVAETFTGIIYRYPWKDGQVTGPRKAFGNVVDPDAPGDFKGPDGMKFGADGKLYVAVFGQGDVTVLNADGTVDRRIKAGGIYPTNLVFGPVGEQSIYVTEVETGSVRQLRVGTDGLPLYGCR